MKEVESLQRKAVFILRAENSAVSCRFANGNFGGRGKETEHVSIYVFSGLVVQPYISWGVVSGLPPPVSIVRMHGSFCVTYFQNIMEGCTELKWRRRGHVQFARRFW
jgi:hypothetical protein